MSDGGNTIGSMAATKICNLCISITVNLYIGDVEFSRIADRLDQGIGYLCERCGDATIRSGRSDIVSSRVGCKGGEPF